MEIFHNEILIVVMYGDFEIKVGVTLIAMK